MNSPDEKFMHQALSIARRGVGNTWPNPSVGCVIVKGATIIGRGWTAQGGRPHAEAIALDRAGKEAKGAIAYVTLEPCCHHGKTPPCTDALIRAGIVRVVIGAIDPDKRVAGKGVEALKKAGIEVVTGVLEQEAEELNAGFFKRIKEGRPYITLKMATTLDGKIALSNKESRWITGEDARSFAHALRSRNNAIMVGSGTVAADDPELSCRLPGLEDRSPVRVIVDSNLKIPLSSKLVKTAQNIPLWIITLAKNKKEKNWNLLAEKGIKLIEVSDRKGRPKLTDAMEELGKLGINRLLVEGGSSLATSLLKENLVDEIIMIQAPKIIGNDGVAAIGDMGFSSLEKITRFKIVSTQLIGEDTVKIMKKV